MKCGAVRKLCLESVLSLNTARKMENFELVPRSENTFFILVTASKFTNFLFRKPIVSVIICIQTQHFIPVTYFNWFLRSFKQFQFIQKNISFSISTIPFVYWHIPGEHVLFTYQLILRYLLKIISSKLKSYTSPNYLFKVWLVVLFKVLVPTIKICDLRGYKNRVQFSFLLISI